MSRIKLLGCPIDSLDLNQTIAEIEIMLKDGRNHQHVVVNAAKMVEMWREPDLKNIISSCDLINADGMAIVWASKILGMPLPGRVTGVDLYYNLVRLCAEKGYRPFFFGARQCVVEKVVEHFKEKFPAIEIAGFRNGYYEDAEEAAIVKSIKESSADMLFVGFSSPKKEMFLNKWMNVMEIPFCMGVGGSFDIVAGKTKRAPELMQQIGLEWFYRLCQEPKRMWKRYAITNPIFIWLVIKEYLNQRN